MWDKVSCRDDTDDLLTYFTMVGDNADVVWVVVIARSQDISDGYVY